MATILTWPFPTAYTTEGDTIPRVKLASFGDGYEQRSPDGINNLPRSVQYVGDFQQPLITQMDAFLSATNGVTPFFYTPPFSPRGQGLFVADTGWQITYNSFDYNTIKCVFREVFELH